MTRSLTARRLPRPPRSAFTLIEVLATLALVGIVLPVVVDGILLALATAGVAKDRAEAASLAQNVMAEIVAAGDYQDVADSGRLDPQGREYAWSAQWDEWDIASLKHLTVTVSWERRNRERSVALSTLVYVENGG